MKYIIKKVLLVCAFLPSMLLPQAGFANEDIHLSSRQLMRQIMNHYSVARRLLLITVSIAIARITCVITVF